MSLSLSVVGKGSESSGGLRDLRFESRDERDDACRVAGSFDLRSEEEVDEERDRGGEV